MLGRRFKVGEILFIFFKVRETMKYLVMIVIQLVGKADVDKKVILLTWLPSRREDMR